MRYTIRPKGSTERGGFAVSAMDAREALDHVRDMLERGLTEIEIFDADGKSSDLIELERITSEGEVANGDRT